MKNSNAIAIVSSSLGHGGAERFASLLGTMLHQLGYEVHHIIIKDIVAYDYKGQLLNLGKLVPPSSGGLIPLQKGRHIARYLKQHNIYTIIDIRSRPMLLRELFTKIIYGKRRVFFMIHSSNLEMYLPKSVFWAKFLYQKAAKLVFVSREIEAKAKAQYGFTNTQTIYNPVVFPDKVYDKPTDAPAQYFIFFGRLEDAIKNISLLVEAFSLSEAKEKNYQLLLVGDGTDKERIAQKIRDVKAEKYITILPFQKNIVPYIQHARATLLTSYFEGFPMSLVESLAVGTPVISVDCETGPREIIQHQRNGLLVPNHNAQALAEAVNQMITDEQLYQTCKNNAQKSVEHLSLDTVSQHWQQLVKHS